MTYAPDPAALGMVERAINHLGDKQAAFDKLLDELAPMNMDQAELLATAYAAWNDLLIDDRPADDDAIVAEVHAWHESKEEKFDRKRVLSCLGWMRKHGYVPNSKGQRTRPSTKATELPSRRRGRAKKRAE